VRRVRVLGLLALERRELLVLRLLVWERLD